METNEMRGEAEIHQVEVPPSSVTLATETIQHNPIATGQPTATEQKTLEEIGKQLKTQHKMRMNQPTQIQVKQPVPYPVEAQTARVARNLCAVHGHGIVAIIGKVMRHTGPAQDEFRITEETMVFCTKCGGNLQEIKGQ